MTRFLAFLRSVPFTVYAVLGALTVAGGWLALDRSHQREIGKRDLLIATHERTNADLRRSFDSASKQYRVDTVRVRVTKTRMDTMTVTVESWKTDTLRVVEYVAKADTAIRACVKALLTCDERTAIAQRGWDGARSEIALLKKSIPSSSKKWLYMATGIGAGYVVGRVVK